MIQFHIWNLSHRRRI